MLDYMKEREKNRDSDQDRILTDVTQSEYKYGFYTDIEIESVPRGLNEDIVRMISAKKEEPEWLLEWRLKAFRHWEKMKMPEWAHLKIPEINYQDIIYYGVGLGQQSLAG